MDQLHSPPVAYQGFSRSPTKLFDQPKATKIKVYRNGDVFSPARKMVVNPQGMTLERFMDYVSDELKSYGAVRRLYTPKTGTAITSVEQIRDGSTIVVSRREKFKKFDYAKNKDFRQREIEYRETRAARLPKMRSPVKVLPRRHFIGAEKPKNVVFFRNADKSARKFRVLLTKRNTMSWDQLCQILSDKLVMETAIRKLYTISGKQINRLDEIQDGESYVAVARKPFVQLSYKAAPPMRMSKRPTLPPIQKPGLAKARVRQRPRPPGQPRPAQKNTQQSRRGRSKESSTVAESSPKRNSGYRPLESPSMDPARLAREKTITSPGVISPGITSLGADVPLARERTIVTDAGPPKQPMPVVKPQSYLMKVYTANEDGAGTDANVYITLHGEKTDSPRFPLSEKPGRFQQGTCDVIAVQAEPLGQINRITVEQDNSGPSSAWKLVKVTVRDSVTNKLLYFPAHKWLAGDRGDFMSSATIDASDTDVASPPPPSSDPRVKSAVKPVDDTGFAASAVTESAAEVEDSDETKTDVPVDMTKKKAEEVTDELISDADKGNDSEDDIEYDTEEPTGVSKNNEEILDEIVNAAGDQHSIEEPIDAEIGVHDEVDEDSASVLDISEEAADDVEDVTEKEIVTDEVQEPPIPSEVEDEQVVEDTVIEDTVVEEKSEADAVEDISDEDKHVDVVEDTVVEEKREADAVEDISDEDTQDKDNINEDDGGQINSEATQIEEADEEMEELNSKEEEEEDAKVDGSDKSGSPTPTIEDNQETDKEETANSRNSDQDLDNSAETAEVDGTVEANDEDEDQAELEIDCEVEPETKDYGLTNREEKLRSVISGIREGKLGEAFSTAYDNGESTAKLSDLASAISHQIEELSSLEDIQAAMKQGSSEENIVNGFDEAQLLLASAFYLKCISNEIDLTDSEDKLIDMDNFKAVLKLFEYEVGDDHVEIEYSNLKSNNLASVLEVSMWLAEKRVIPHL